VMSHDAIMIRSNVYDFDLGLYRSEMLGPSMLCVNGDK